MDDLCRYLVFGSVDNTLLTVGNVDTFIVFHEITFRTFTSGDDLITLVINVLVSCYTRSLAERIVGPDLSVGTCYKVIVITSVYASFTLLHYTKTFREVPNSMMRSFRIVYHPVMFKTVDMQSCTIVRSNFT